MRPQRDRTREETRPCRAFAQDDADALEADLEATRDFFIADGEGLPPERAHAGLLPVSRLLDAMAQDTHHLIALYDGDAGVWDKPTLLRVLCHRADRTASKHLKKVLGDEVGKGVSFIDEKRQILASLAHGRPR